MTISAIVIDDHHDVAEVLSEMLRLNSIDVLATGYNGKEAVELYKQHKPDIVLLDYSMPNFDGAYGLENIRKINPYSKVILLTGSMENSATQKLTELESSAILHKPCDMNRLVEMINRVSSGDVIALHN